MRALVAQRIEHLTTDQKVRGSSPFERTYHFTPDFWGFRNPGYLVNLPSNFEHEHSNLT
jgi:hypothetical protein